MSTSKQIDILVEVLEGYKDCSNQIQQLVDMKSRLETLQPRDKKFLEKTLKKIK